MFPNVYGFSWTPGHLIFLGIFFSVVLIIVTTVALAWLRAARSVRTHKADKIRWESNFHDLTPAERACRHQFTGEFRQRVCERSFDCAECVTHGKLIEGRPVPEDMETSVAGLEFPADRMYHRGHTWAREEPDGTVTVGLDEFGTRVFGKPESVRLPKPGERLQRNGAGWTMRRGGIDVNVLAPVDGEVVGTGGVNEGFYLKLKPVAARFESGHLLRGVEIRPWISRELDRLQMLLTPVAAGATLADGGMPVDDMPKALPEANWDAVWGEIFLEP